MQIQIRSNARDVALALRHFAHDQAPFATAVALTRTAQAARDRVRRHYPRAFKLRSRSLPRASIVSVPADKKDWPRSRAMVALSPKFKFLLLQFTGGIKRGERGSRIAVPSRLVRRTRTGRIPAAKKPRRLRDKKNVYVAGPEEGAGRAAIVRRPSKRRKDQRAVFFYLHRRTRQRQRVDMPRIVERAFRRTWEPEFKRQLAQAVERSRPRAPRL